MGSTELFGREPDLVVTSDELMAEGLLIDPDIYGPYVKYGDRPVNRWSNGARDLIRDYFASGASPVPFWGVLGDVLGVIVPDLEEIDPEDGPQNVPPFAFRVPPFQQDPEVTDHQSHPTGAMIWLEPNEVGGWTALLPSEH